MKIGDYVFIETKNKDFKGILMPDSATGKLVLKLDSGYNIGINKNSVKKTKIIKKKTVKKKKTTKVKQKKNLPKISILHTGGTIASKVDYETGGVSAEFKPEEILKMFPKLKNIANIDSRLIFNIFSEDMGFKHYNVLAKEILKEVKKGSEGIIITHGTDTMHYTSAALSFILENLSVPVILVGSQRSSDRGSSDSGMNLMCAVNFIVNSKFYEVGICMHESMSDDYCLIIPGLKARKFHSSRRDAFKVVNDKAIARVSKDGKVSFFRNNFKKENTGDLKLNLIKENLKIGVLKVHPNLTPIEISNYSGFDGLIIEGTGLGHLGVSNKRILTEIKKLSKKMPVVMCSQTIFGRVNMNVYSTGRILQEYTSSGRDMLSEVAFVKLAWLLSNHKKDTLKLISKNLKGEINPRIIDEFL